MFCGVHSTLRCLVLVLTAVMVWRWVEQHSCGGNRDRGAPHWLWQCTEWDCIRQRSSMSSLVMCPRHRQDGCIQRQSSSQAMKWNVGGPRDGVCRGFDPKNITNPDISSDFKMAPAKHPGCFLEVLWGPDPKQGYRTDTGYLFKWAPCLWGLGSFPEAGIASIYDNCWDSFSYLDLQCLPKAWSQLVVLLEGGGTLGSSKRWVTGVCSWRVCWDSSLFPLSLLPSYNIVSYLASSFRDTLPWFYGSVGINRAKWPWTGTSETINQNKPFFL